MIDSFQLTSIFQKCSAKGDSIQILKNTNLYICDQYFKTHNTFW